MAYWTDRYFGSLYHEIYSNYLLDPQRAVEEAAFAAQVLDLGRRTVLDVACGFGRHARLLAASNKVIAIDRMADYVRVAREETPPRAKKNMVAVQADMRELPLPNASVDAAVMLFNSFGYFGGGEDDLEAPEEKASRQVWKLPSVFYERQLVDTSFGTFKDPVQTGEAESSPDHIEGAPVVDENGRVLSEILRVLRPGGGLLLEVPNKRLLLEAVEENPRRMMVFDKYEVQEQFEWDAQRSRLLNRTKFVSGDREEASGYSMRLYSPAEIRNLVSESGLKIKRIYGDYDGGRFGPASSDSMVIHASRPVRVSRT